MNISFLFYAAIDCTSSESKFLSVAVSTFSAKSRLQQRTGGWRWLLMGFGRGKLESWRAAKPCTVLELSISNILRRSLCLNGNHTKSLMIFIGFLRCQVVFKGCQLKATSEFIEIYRFIGKLMQPPHFSWFFVCFRGISWQTLHNSSCFATGLMYKMMIMSALVYSWNWFQNQSQTIFARGEVFTETMSLVANPGLMNPNVHVLCFKNKPSLILKEFKCKLIRLCRW